MPQNIKIITDSASDLPHEYREKYDITVVPLSVLFGEEEFKDGVSITTEQFWEKLRTEDAFPATNQVNPHEFVEAFRPHLENKEPILYIGISQKLSGTLQSSLLAKDMLGADQIHVFDSRSASLGESLYVIKAARMAEQGHSIAEIIDTLTNLRTQAFGYFMLDSLDHIVRGGRLSKTQGFIGSILNVKPILHFTPEGTVVVSDKVRSTKKALQFIIDKALEQRSKFQTVSIVHTHDAKSLAEFRKMVEEQLQPTEIIQGMVGPTIGTHAGPGGVGLLL